MSEYSALILKKFGSIDESLEINIIKPKKLLKNDVRVQMKMAAINPSDINMIEGKYGSLPKLPSTLGIDGYGLVTEVGASVSRVKSGDRVIVPKVLGAFSNQRVVDETEVVPVPSHITDEQATFISINPMSAYLMLKLCTDEIKDSYLIQNAANSAVGLSIISFARHFGLKTINVVRDQSQIEPLVKQGAFIVITEDDLYSHQFQEEVKKLKVSCGLNAVGGKNARYLARCLSKKAILITYGAMSKQPFTIDNGPLIFNEITIRGFWRKSWSEHVSNDEHLSTYEELFELYKSCPVNIPIASSFPLNKYKEAIEKSKEGKRNGKIVLHFES